MEGLGPILGAPGQNFQLRGPRTLPVAALEEDTLIGLYGRDDRLSGEFARLSTEFESRALEYSIARFELQLAEGLSISLKERLVYGGRGHNHGSVIYVEAQRFGECTLLLG